MKKCVPVLLALAAVTAVPCVAEEAKVDGKALYAKKCAMCHGADGVAKATAKGSANFNDPAYAATEEEIVKVAMEGKGKMPKFEGKLKPEEVQAIAAHIKTMVPKP